MIPIGKSRLNQKSRCLFRCVEGGLWVKSMHEICLNVCCVVVLCWCVRALLQQSASVCAKSILYLVVNISSCFHS